MLKHPTNKLKLRNIYKAESDEDSIQILNENVEESAMERSPEPPDSPDRFMLCTQPDVVSWSWDSPEAQIKSKKSNGGEIPKNKTPKTAQLKCQKNKGSPLMYRPKPEVLRSQTLQQMEMMINAYSNHEPSTSVDNQVQKEAVEKKSPEKLTLTPTRKVGVKQKSFDDLFNDSMDEELFQCSQQFVNEEQSMVEAFKKSLPTAEAKSVLAPKKPRQNCHLSIPDDSFDDLILSSIKVVEETKPLTNPRSSLSVSKAHSDPTSELERNKTTPKTNKFIRYNSFESTATYSNNNGHNLGMLDQKKRTNLFVSTPKQSSNRGRVRSKEEIERNRKLALQRKRERQKLAFKELVKR